jgi:hypothetical protein
MLTPLTLEAVIETASELIEKYEYTTTLDVKSCLRDQDYDARQVDVSNFMEQIRREQLIKGLAFEISEEGLFREYFIDKTLSDVEEEENTSVSTPEPFVVRSTRRYI